MAGFYERLLTFAVVASIVVSGASVFYVGTATNYSVTPPGSLAYLDASDTVQSQVQTISDKLNTNSTSTTSTSSAGFILRPDVVADVFMLIFTAPGIVIIMFQGLLSSEAITVLFPGAAAYLSALVMGCLLIMGIFAVLYALSGREV